MAFVPIGNIKGQKGDSITGIAKTATNGLIDTYTITLDNGSTKTFTVTNGYTPTKGVDYFDGSVTSVAGKSGDVVLAKADVGLSNVDNTADMDKPVSTLQAAAFGLKANASNPTITGLKERSVAMGANAIDLSLGNYFTKTISGATTLTVSNVPTSGTVGYFILELTNGGAGAVTYPTGTKWAKGTAPTLTASGIDLLRFVTRDAGTTWRGSRIDEDSK